MTGDRSETAGREDLLWVGGVAVGVAKSREGDAPVGVVKPGKTLVAVTTPVGVTKLVCCSVTETLVDDIEDEVERDIADDSVQVGVFTCVGVIVEEAGCDLGRLEVDWLRPHPFNPASLLVCGEE